MARFTTHNEDEDEPDESNCESVPSSAAVVPWIRPLLNQAMSNDSSPTFHLYHIQRFRSTSPEHPQLTSKKQRQYYLKRCIIQSFLLFLTLKVVCRYMPPPPHPYNSWNDYTNEIKASVGNTAVLISYVSIGLMKNAAQDIWYHGQEMTKLLMNEMAHIRIKTSSHIHTLLAPSINYTTCTFQLPHNPLNTSPSRRIYSYSSQPSTTEDYLMKEIVGQEKAIKAIARALDAWIQPSLHPNPSNLIHGNGKPLFLLFTGTEGVGKSQTVNVITQMLFSHCLVSYPKDRVLILHGYDYSSSSSSILKDDNRTSVSCTGDYTLDTQQECTADNSLVEMVAQHTLDSHELGNIIVIDHVETMSPLLLRQLGERIQKSNGQLLHRTLYSHRIISLHKTIFILTTDWGSDWTFTLLRKYMRPMNIPYRELQNAIKDDVRQYIGDYMLPNIIPFFPLSSNDIERILKKIILDINTRYENVYWKKLDVDDAVYRHFTNPNYVEYLELTSANPTTSSRKESFVFAKRGAHDLDDNIFLQALKALMTRGYFNQARKIAYIDYDEPSDELILSWCNEHHEGGQYKRQCEEGWRGKLD